MKIDVIEDINTFSVIRQNWESVYQDDPEAIFYLSWHWLNVVLGNLSDSWFILSVKLSNHADQYIAFFPLVMTVNWPAGGTLINSVYEAGNHVADYSGFICLPDYTDEVVITLSDYLKQMPHWNCFHISGLLATDIRMEKLLRQFTAPEFKAKQINTRNPYQNIDNDICPYIPLEINASWEDYLQSSLSANTRQKIRRFLRKVEEGSEFTITQAASGTIERDIDILLSFWKTKWEPIKGTERTGNFLKLFRHIFRYCFEEECLCLPILWRSGKPLGALVHFIDRKNQSILFYMAGRDGTVKNPPPGLILHAYSIRYAFKYGFRTYDFLRGNESYKYSFGVQERYIRHIAVSRTQKTALSLKLHPKTLDKVLKLSAERHKLGRLPEAEFGYTQILAANPHHQAALYRLGILMQQKGDLVSAESCFKQLIEQCPTVVDAWFKLANLYQMQGRLTEAILAYRKVLEQKPDAIAAYNNLGYALYQQQEWVDAIACYEKALSLQPNLIEVEVNLANARYAQGVLSNDKLSHYAFMNHDLGIRRQRSGDFEMAIAYYRQAIEMLPDLAEAHYSLGEALQKKGKPMESIACYQKALALNPSLTDAEIRLNHLLSL